jgi:hypothetical protein
MKQKLRHYWHHLYYAFSSRSGVEFAMRCKDVTEIVDLGKRPTTLIGRLRFRLHLSLCQACQNYFDTTQTLKEALRSFINKNKVPVQMDRLNEDLMKKYADYKKSTKP